MFRIVSAVSVSFLILSCGTFFFRKNGKKAAKHKFIPSFYSRLHLVPIGILHSRGDKHEGEATVSEMLACMGSNP